MHRILFALIVAIAVSGAAVAQGSIVVALADQPPSLDPHTSEAWFAFTVTAQLYDQLVVRDLTTQVISPSLATSWTSNADGTEWVLELREDVEFHDGTKFDAEAVRFSFMRIIDPGTRSPAAAPLLDDNLEAVEVVDDYTVRFIMKRPFSGFLDALTQSYGGLTVVSPAAVAQYGEDFGQNPVGTGPFMMEEWEPGSHITVVRNPNYTWGPEALYGRSGPAYLESIRFEFVPEDAVRTAMLQRGSADVIWRVPEPSADMLESSPDTEVIQIIRPGTGSMMQMNASKAPTDDVLVRRAIMHLIDYRAINDIVYAGVPEDAVSVISPVTPGYRPSVDRYEQYPIDVESANALLDEAGWLRGANGMRAKDGVPMELVNICFPGPACQDAEVMQAQLAAAGIALDIQAMGQPANVQATQRGEHNLRSIGWGGSDAAKLLRFLYHPENAGSGWNFTFYEDEAFSMLLDEATAALDEQERFELVGQIEDIVFDQALSIPRSYYTWLVGVRENVNGVFFDPANALPMFANTTVD
jgi:peptide/nickel transport system substrate-binding protein